MDGGVLSKLCRNELERRMSSKTLVERLHARLTIFCILAALVFPPLGWSQAPIFKITPAESWINF